MITKKQWNKFCNDVWSLRSSIGYEGVKIHGRGVKGIEYNLDKTYTLKTIAAGTPTMTYTYKESIDSYMNLAQLYQNISISSNMNSLMPHLKKG